MKKILIVFILSMVVLMCSKETSAMTLDELKESIRDYNEIVSDSFEINERLMGLIESGVEEAKSYGGVYLNELGELIVRFKDQNDLSIFKYIFDRNNNERKVKFRLSDNSLFDLEDIKEKLWVDSEEYGINGIGISQTKNKVCINVNSNEDKIKLENSLSAREKEVTLIEVEEEAKFTSTESYKYAKPAHTTYYKGFLGLKTEATIFLNAYDRETGERGVILPAHYAAENKNYYTKNGTLIGNKITKRQLGGEIDAAFVPFTDTLAYDYTMNLEYKDAEKKSQTLLLKQLAGESDFIENLEIYQFSQMNGFKKLVITDTSYSVKIRGYQFDNVLQYKGNVESGDSGAPTWYINGSLSIVVSMTFAAKTGSGLGIRPRAITKQFKLVPFVKYG